MTRIHIGQCFSRLYYIDSTDSLGSLRSLKVFVGHTEDLGKLFFQCDLCGTFTCQWCKCSPMNMEMHRHPELVATTRISRFEEEKMEIPSRYTDFWREPNNIPDSDAIEAPVVLDSEGRYSRKRGTSDVSQASTASIQPSPSKKHR